MVTCKRERGALKSRDLTTRHQIKQIATGWTSVGSRKNRTCWTISELNPVCHDSTAALPAVSACSQPWRSYVPTPAGRQQQQQQQQRGRIREQTGACASSVNFREVGIGNSSRGNNDLGRLLQSVHRGATCWLRTGAVRTADIEYARGRWNRETWHRETCFSVRVDAHYKFMFDAGNIIWAAHRFYVCY